MKVASHQPAFLPWPGFWHKAMSVDLFVLSARVQWAKDGYLNRIRHAGAWLTLPVDSTDNVMIDRVSIGTDQRLIGKTLKAVQQIPGPFKSRLAPVIGVLDSVRPGDNLVEVNVRLLREVAQILKISARFTLDQEESFELTTSLRLKARLHRHTPLITDYFAGRGAVDYLEPADFSGSQVWLQENLGLPTDRSIVHLAATEPDPADFIAARGGWSKL